MIPLPSISRPAQLGGPNRGYSLIEVLVAVLILSMGLLAMAGIHATSFKLTLVNNHRMVAMEIASFLSEAVKANNEAAISNTGYIFNAVGSANPQPGQTCNGVAANCTPAQLAAVDLYNARLTASRILPLGDVFTQFNAAANNTGGATSSLTIWVHWASPNITGNTAVDTSLESRCPTAVANLAPRRSCVQYMVSL